MRVRVSRLPLQSRGPAATTPGLHPGNGGSSPSGTTRAQLRQSAERLGLNPSVCRFDSHLSYNTSSQSSPECSPPCHGGDRRFKSDRGRLDSAVRKLAKRRSSNLRGLWVRFPPVLHASVGHWQAPVAVTHPLSSFAGSTPARRTKARSFRGRIPGSQPGEAGSIPARVTTSRVGQRPAEFHKLRPPGATPGPAT